MAQFWTWVSILSQLLRVYDPGAQKRAGLATEVESRYNVLIEGTGRYRRPRDKQADREESSEWGRGMQMLTVWWRRDTCRYQR